jgi:hypothetical protein
MTIPPHIPTDSEASREMPRHSRVKHLLVTLTVSALSGFIASLLYASFGPSATYHTSTETRVERVAEVADEALIKISQESIAVFATEDGIDQLTAFGTAITGDGWFVVPASAVKAKHVIMFPQKSSVIESVVADSATGFMFAKTSIKNARLLPYGTFDSIGRGAKLTIVLPQTAIPVTVQDLSVCITDHCPSEYGDKLSYAVGIVEVLPQFMVDGAPVISSQGNLVGLAMRAGTRVVIVPMADLRPVFSSVFSQGVAAHSKIALPVRAVNLTRWPMLDATGLLPEQGMLIETSAVPGLKEGDVISAIERQPIESNSTLFGMMSRLQDVEKISMTIVRKNVTMDVTIPLK